MIDACCGLLVVLSAQFGTYDFSPAPAHLVVEDNRDGMESGIGGYFRVRFPANWPLAHRYDFEWEKLAGETDPFETIDYSKIPP